MVVIMIDEVPNLALKITPLSAFASQLPAEQWADNSFLARFDSSTFDANVSAGRQALFATLRGDFALRLSPLGDVNIACQVTDDKARHAYVSCLDLLDSQPALQICNLGHYQTTIGAYA